VPYLELDRRALLLDGACPAQAGELNYLVTQVCQRFLTSDGHKRPTYADYNAAIGALECAKLELYRRLIVPYEENRRRENGDAYGGGAPHD
jgi:hypothetical protein